VGQEKLDVVNESVIKAVGMFGGGVARSGNTCGALLGAPEEKENPVMWVLGDILVSRFEELTAPYGGVRCQDIARVDWQDPLAAREFRTNPESRRKLCAQLVGDTAYALGELIEKELPAR
jgi:hypothetical protein